VLAAALLAATLCAAGIHDLPAPANTSVGEAPAGLAAELFAGAHALRAEPQARLVVGFLGVQQIVLGALDLLFLTIAFRLLGIGSAGTGFLSAAWGIGAIVGGLAAAAVVGRRLAPPLLGGAGIMGLGLAAVGLAPALQTAPGLIGAAGAGRTVINVAGRTLLLRVVPDHLLARVFGVLEGLTLVGLAAGMLIAPVLVAALGPRPAILVVAALLPVVALLIWARLIRLDARSPVPVEQLRLLRAIPLFAPLSPPVLERLARSLVPLAASAGTIIIRQGDHGDRFSVLTSGEVDVFMNGRHIDAHGPGGYFGEVALLRDIPRTASVMARTAATLYALERDAFLAAVTGHPESARAADTISRARYEDRLRELADERGA
jgi:MFS family permease